MHILREAHALHESRPLWNSMPIHTIEELVRQMYHEKERFSHTMPMAMNMIAASDIRRPLLQQRNIINVII